jgi:thiamine biosynthesis lipoprotein|tara:strand:+ start:6547 stop:7566 length:1020 start_codon:yes stop_codon:yes gene_type:complete
MRKIARYFIILSFWLSLTACQKHDSVEYYHFSGTTMGTEYNIKFASVPEVTELKLVKDEIATLLNHLNHIFSTYDEASELMLLNAHPINQPYPISHELYTVLDTSLDISQATGGKFDVTVGPLIESWGFGASKHNAEVPPQEIIEQGLAQIGYQGIELKSNFYIVKSKPVVIDLSAIAKGYAVDQVANYLTNLGIEHYMVEIGGEVGTKGLNPKGVGWRIGIEKPNSGLQREALQAVDLSNHGAATSGDYRNYYEVDGKRYSHTIDPTTGYPITHNLASVTVLHKQVMLADAYATAFMVMGADEALRFAEANNLAIFVVTNENGTFTTRYSSAFKPFLL